MSKKLRKKCLLLKYTLLNIISIIYKQNLKRLHLIFKKIIKKQKKEEKYLQLYHIHK